MSNKIKSEIIILCKSKFFIWIFTGELVLMAYNAFKVGSQMQSSVKGGYYTYILMTLAYLLGIVLPIAMGGFLGGFDEQEKMMEYKLCNQSRRCWFVTKLLTILVLSMCVLLMFTGVGVLVDLWKGTMEGAFFSNFVLIIQRFGVVWAIWMFWGLFSFGIGLISNSSMGSVIFSMLIYYGEQYIGRYLRVSYGILWNQKSIEHFFFGENSVPFGVVQSSYENIGKSSIYLFGWMILVFSVSYIYLKKKYPMKRNFI
jgi:hypothetical protein